MKVYPTIHIKVHFQCWIPHRYSARHTYQIQKARPDGNIKKELEVSETI